MEICLWCTTERENVVEFLEQYAASSLSQDQLQTATEDLNNCADCVSEYHLARSQVPHLHKRLWVLETKRLLTRFCQMTQDDIEDDLFIVEDNQERPVSKMTMGEFEAALRIPLIEILQYPYLLAHSKLSDVCLDALCRIESIDIKEKYKGIYLLLVHPNEKVRSWAIATARMLGCVDRDDFYDVEEVLACMFCVLELGISFPLEDSDPPSACNGKLARMPAHLYDSSNVKNYWLGICMLLTVLDAQAMDSLFLGPNKQTNILQCILNAMEEEGREFDSTSDPFWPALQCFMVILDRLGPLSWGYIDPIKAFNIITDSSSYISEIETIRSNTRMNVKEEIEDDDLVTCSQMVYATFLQQKSSKSHRSHRAEGLDQQVYKEMASLVSLLHTELGKEMHLYNSTFLWFIPFVRSVMNMAELSIHYIQPVVQYLRDQVRKMVTKSAIWDKVTVFFAYLLVHVVEMLLTEGRMDILQHCSYMWIKIIVKGAMIDNMMGTGGYEVSVSSSSSMWGSGRSTGGAMSSLSSTLHLACLKVIRLVLKEGGRLGPDLHPRALYFLNLLNKHLRDATPRGWSLSVSEQNELQQCLKHLAETFAKKVPMSASTAASVSALPTPPAETAAMESPFLGQVDLSFIKKEPVSCSSPVRDMDCTSNVASVKDELAVDIHHLKPDLGKLQAIRSRLSDNLPKMQAIVQNKPDGADHVSPPSLVSEGKRSPGSPRPSTSTCAQTSRLPNEKEDDEPLLVMQQRLIQGENDESEEESNVSIIVISDEDMASVNGVESGDDMGPLFKIKKEQEHMVESPGRDFDGDLSESQVFEFETQEDVASAWSDTRFDSAGSSKDPVRVAFETEFVKPKSPPQKVSSKKPKPKPPPPIIEPQPLRKKRTSAAHQVAQAANVEAPVDAPSTSRVHASTPAIVPPKKFRKVPEPTSTVERLGLKKRKRTAFDLSQRSLTSVEELRRYGQTVQVEKKVKRLRISKPTSTHKTMGKNQKLLASQEMQFHRLSRNQVQKVTSQTKQTTPLSPTLQAQTARSCTSEGKKHEGNGSNDSNMQSCDLDQRSNGSGDGTPTGSAVESDDGKDEERQDIFVGHDWNLTLCDPTDMELCSQMEQFDEENDADNNDDDDDGVFLTQRDPIDMDIDDDDDEQEPLSTVPSVPVDQPRETSSPPMAPSLPQPSAGPLPCTMHQSDDPLKPDMPSMAQKKARPSTTKIYTPSSRNDTLVQDLKLPPPKPKIAHQALMPPPLVPPLKPRPPAPAVPRPIQRPSAPSVFRPAPILKAPPHPLRPVEPSHKPAPQPPPTYKTYPRPEASTSSSRQPSLSHNLRASVLKANVLKWKYSFFEECKQFGPPEALCDMPLKLVPQTFRSFMDYFQTFFPLLVTNTFEELFSEWLREDRVKLKLMVQSVDYGSLDTGLFTVTNANFFANLTPKQESQQLYPKEDDVVILWLPQNTASYARSPFSDEHKPDDCQPHFGVVARSNVIIAGARRDLKLKVQTCGNVLSVDKQQVQCEVIGSMLSAMRELNALCHIQDKALIQTILAPDKHFAHFLPATQVDQRFEGCNIEQAKAIDCGVSMVMSGQPTPKICMIHGPPGTGKSDTIVNLLYQLSQRGAADPTGQKRLHALVCAPSNAAVDNLMKKIIVFFKGQSKDGKRKGNCGDVNLVRLGSERTICEEVVAFSLDSQTRSRTVKAQNIEQRIAELEQNMHNLTHMCAMAQDPAKLAQLRDKNLKLNEERERLSHQMKQCRSGRQNTQRLILQEANIICCTLSTSGSMVLEMAFRRRGRVPFNCVIVDEAGQAKETETLIPLLFRCPSVVLVGDPDQLPPTVISQKVKELGFDQSLMARLYKCIMSNRLSPPRIHFLSQQYRMHPDICSFPSRYIYNNVLKTDRAIAQNRCSKEWACESYRVLDVADGQEMRENDSYFNPKEVKLTVELVQLILEVYQNRVPSQSLRGIIGVITPYSGQKFRIRSALRQRNLQKVVVDTVDGFQGREMDCIIVSCVRASNEMGSIGFLGNRNRMNVTITRAKYSLFILGHLRTLREHSDWRALIEDAESRGTIITTKEQHFKTDARKIFKRDALPPPPHRTQDWPSNRPRSNSTPPYPNTTRDHRAPQSTKLTQDPRSSNASSGTIASRPASSTTARGPDPTGLPRDPRQRGTSLDTAPSRHPSSTTARGPDPTGLPRDPRQRAIALDSTSTRPASSTTARGPQDPADRPRDPRQRGVSSNTAPSRHPNLRVIRDRRDSSEHERRRPSQNQTVSSSSTVQRSNSIAHQPPSNYSRRERH